MPLQIPNKEIETPLRRQITGFNFGVLLDTADIPAQIPTLSASVVFTDIWRNAEGNPVAYPVSQSVALTHTELLAVHPAALQVLGALQALAYSKAAEQGL